MKFRTSVFKFFATLAAIFLFFASACYNPQKDNGADGPQEHTKYRITFYLNGGAFPGEFPKEFYAGESVELPVPEREGHNFGGWYDNADFNGAKYLVLEGKYANCDKFFWAKWEVKKDTSEPKTPEIFKIILILNGGYIDGEVPESYAAGKRFVLPEPYKFGYIFGGWYDNIEFNGEKITEITEDSSGNKIFYAKWIIVDEETEKFKIHYNLNGGGFAGDFPKEYVKGKRLKLPIPIYEGYVFAGWFDNEKFYGNAILEIDETFSGDLNLYAKWEKKEEVALKILRSSGYEEGAFVEVEALPNSDISDYSAEYRREDRPSEWNSVDKELLRFCNGYVRIDLTGVAAGRYGIRIYARGKSADVSDISVTSFDRSGYAHFNNKIDGVGAYSADGTLKPNAKIIYVSEQTKDSVELRLDDRVYCGIKNIFNAAEKFNGTPLVVRITGRLVAENLALLGAVGVTIEGIGSDAEIVGNLKFNECSFIEIRNLTFSDYNGAACRFFGENSRIWIHNNEFKEGIASLESSERAYALNFQSGDFVTVSYNVFMSGRAEKIENGNETFQFFTLHHNIYKNSESCAAGKVNLHVYNNFYSCEGNGGSPLSLSGEAYAFMENCHMLGCPIAPFRLENSFIKIWNCLFENCATHSGYGIFIAESRDDSSAALHFFDTDNSVFYYDYYEHKSAVEKMNNPQELEALLQALAGVLKV